MSATLAYAEEFADAEANGRLVTSKQWGALGVVHLHENGLDTPVSGDALAIKTRGAERWSKPYLRGVLKQRSQCVNRALDESRA